MINIRLAEESDLAELSEIEKQADKIFVEHGIDIGNDETQSIDTLNDALRNKRLWVAEDGDELVGFSLVILINENAHLEQVSVLPRMQKQGIGAKLVKATIDWAQQNNYERITLSTFNDVPWNQNFYAKLGFRDIPSNELDKTLKDLRSTEARLGLDITKRVFMAYTIDN
ncbi:MAG: GNAT family N-acetyltransferase [Acidimicrobiia bacterium]